MSNIKSDGPEDDARSGHSYNDEEESVFFNLYQKALKKDAPVDKDGD